MSVVATSWSTRNSSGMEKKPADVQLLMVKHFLARAFLELTRLLSSAHAAGLSKKRGRARDLAGLRELVERQQLEIDLLRARLARLDSAKRPRCLPSERLQIQLYRAKWPTSLTELARRFVLSVETIKAWLIEVDGGVEKRVKTKAPVNKLPDAVREIAVLLRWDQLLWGGAKRIADVLRRTNLKISRTSIQRILRRSPRKPAVKEAKPKARPSGIKAKSENHVWIVDLTHVVSFMGLLRVRVVAIIDAYTRAIVATGVSKSEPTADWMCAFVAKAIKTSGSKPMHMISDRGSQFTASPFRAMLRRRGIRHRFGAVGTHGSIATIERMWRSLKSECLNSTCAWLSARALARKVADYSDWYNAFRPHQGLRGRTPCEVAAKAKRPKPLAIKDGDAVRVSRRHLHGDPKLPIYTIRVKKSA
jgi:putative transposase